MQLEKLCWNFLSASLFIHRWKIVFTSVPKQGEKIYVLLYAVFMLISSTSSLLSPAINIIFAGINFICVLTELIRNFQKGRQAEQRRNICWQTKKTSEESQQHLRSEQGTRNYFQIISNNLLNLTFLPALKKYLCQTSFPGTIIHNSMRGSGKKGKRIDKTKQRQKFAKLKWTNPSGVNKKYFTFYKLFC